MQSGTAILEFDVRLGALGFQRRRGDRLAPIGVHHFMTHAPDVPELAAHAPAGIMNGLENVFPAGFLGIGEDTRRIDIAACGFRDVGGLGDDHARAGTLGIIGLLHFTRHLIRAAGARERRHEYPVGQFHGADRHR